MFCLLLVFLRVLLLNVVRVLFFFNDTATTEIYTLSLHDALPICGGSAAIDCPEPSASLIASRISPVHKPSRRSEEHTSELQSQSNLVCRLLLEKKKKPCRTNSNSPRR